MSFTHREKSYLARSQRRDSIDTEREPRAQEKRPVSIKLTIVNAIIAAAIALFMVSIGYIGNDFKKSYADLGQVKTDLMTTNSSVSKLEDKVDITLGEINKKLDQLLVIHVKN